MRFFKLLLAATLIFSGTANAKSTIFSGSDIKTLKSNIDLNGNSKIMSGSVNPKSSATSAPIGTIYLNSSTGISYRKLDAGSTTNWEIYGGPARIKNYVLNPSCAVDTSSITASGGSLTRGTTTPLDPDTLTECLIDASADDQTYTWALDTFTTATAEYLKNGNCEVPFKYEGDASLYKAYVKVGSTQVTSDLQLTNATSPQFASILFPCGDLSSAPTFTIESTSASAAAISVAKVNSGEPSNIGSVSQALFIGSSYFATTASCNWTRTNTALGAFTTTAACPGPTVELNPGPGTIQTTDADLPQWTVTNLRPGNYQIIIDLSGYVGSAGNLSAYSINDGTTTSGKCAGSESTSATDNIPCTINANFSYTTAQSSVTFSVFGAAQSGSVNVANAAALAQTRISIYYFPSGGQQAVSVNQNTLPTIQKFTSGSGTYTKPYGVSHIKVRMVGGGGGGSGADSSGGNNGTAGAASTFGNLSAGGGSGGIWNGAGGAGGSNTVGAGWTDIGSMNGNGGQALSAGAAVGNIFAGAAGGEGFFGGRAASSNYANSGSAPTTNSGSGGQGGGTNNTANVVVGSGGGAGGYIESLVSGVTSDTYAYSVGTNGSGGGGGGGGLSGAAGASGTIIVEEFYQQANVPILVGSVSSNSGGAERIERLTFGGASEGVNNCTASPCTIFRQSGSWATSVTRTSSGLYTINVPSGMFSSLPSCTCSAVVLGTGPVGCGISNPGSATAIVLATTGLADAQISVSCQGPR